jgi:hypothetical protein
MADSIYEYVVERLDANRSGKAWKMIADESGVSLRTIEKIGRKTTKNPRIQTVEQLAAYFRKHPVVNA